ncbi:CAP domain-containing protein [Aspergillus ibericus CBS 121593]|uniref:PR-1-like protein n=1 Tax=Aspergillus ibericus CBS 121593 TaxID=1448316 RepID=A0A395GKI6_9EURO|nr:PR-1-like protein [Aspergillus ibericus CBS 121593]RAK95558.1 PR-1-like protein [Aspergillus ibericus CBS 121593]
MRYSYALGALCAAGAMAHNVDKRSYVTDWTVVTVTTTITEYPSTPTVYENVAVEADTSSSSVAVAVDSTSAAAAAAAAAETTTSSVVTPVVEATTSVAAAVVDTTSVAAAADTTTSVAAAEPTTTAAAVITTSTSEEAAAATAWTSAWTSYWTSSWSSAAAESTTLATSTSSSATSTATSAYQSAVLYNHNVHRSNHSASSLSWSSSLESSAYTLAAKCVYEHDTSIDGGGYGQNIGYGVSADEIGVMITNLMYNDEMGYYTDLYGEADPDMTYFDSWGHFSQIVWAATTEVGCATVTCNSLGNVDASEALPFTVCNYSPAGNYEGEYGTNVKRPLGQAMYVAS